MSKTVNIVFVTAVTRLIIIIIIIITGIINVVILNNICLTELLNKRQDVSTSGS